MLEKFFLQSAPFASLKEDGSVVVWGDSFQMLRVDGITSDQINGGVITNIFSNGNSYATLKNDETL